MTPTWWQIVIAPAFTLLGVVLTMAFNAKSQARRLGAESEAARAARSEDAEREDRRRFMVQRRDVYSEFAAAVDAWMIEAETQRYLRDEHPDAGDEEDSLERLNRSGLLIRAALNHMTLVSPLHVLDAAGNVNSAAREDAPDPLAVQPLLLKFLFECRRDLIGEASWPRGGPR